MGDSEILSMICQIGIFIVCAQTVTHFRPNASYEKYFKLLVSLMILAQIIQPLSEVFSKRGQEDLEERINRAYEELECRMQDYALEEVDMYLQEQETRRAAEANEEVTK